jgi:hypothetical protein
MLRHQRFPVVTECRVAASQAETGVTPSTATIMLETKKKNHFLLDFGPGQLTCFMFILSYEAGFYKSIALKVNPPICRVTVMTG